MLLKEKGEAKSSVIMEALGGASIATVKRDIRHLVDEGLIESVGRGRGTRYRLTGSYLLLGPIDLDAYYSQEIDERDIVEHFNWALLRDTLPGTLLFSAAESAHMRRLQQEFQQHVSELSPAAYRKELERLSIDLSWKSSQIEGNTYSLLETERLLNERQTAAGKTKEEAVMLLNHKDAIDFIVGNRDFMKPLSVSAVEAIHGLLIKELDVDRNIRIRRVGITGTKYQPLDNEFQIREALEALCGLVNGRSDMFEKALLTLALISYIQPFMDGNKRTARIVSNAVLIGENGCPLSFRTADSEEYKKAMLVFYEQNNISCFKKIFMEQFEFAVKTYF
jgi:Fic family protein